MAERALEFRTPLEVETARPQLDRDCTVSLTEFAGLVGRYVFQRADWVACQLDEKGEGHVCRQEHGRGWLARRKDGKEAFIGRDCANKHFGADSNFSAEAARINRELRIDDLVARIKARQSDPMYTARLDAATLRQRELRDQVSRNRDRWPNELLRRLQDMEKTGNRSVMLSVRYVEKDENGRETYENQPVQWGSISAPNALDLARVRVIGSKLESAQQALDEAVPTREQSEKALRVWIDAIDELDRCEAALEEVSDDLAAFLAPDNLRLLCWTVRQHHVQDLIVRTVLEVINGAPVSDSVVAMTKRQWVDAIRSANGGRDFHVSA